MFVGVCAWAALGALPATAAKHFAMEEYVPLLDPDKANERRMIELYGHIKQVPSDRDARRELANLWFSWGLAPVAQDMLKQLLEEDDKDYMAWNDLGKIYLSGNKHRKARSAFNRAIDIKPNFGAAYYNIAVSKDMNRENSGLFEMYLKAISLDPALADPTKNYHLAQNTWTPILLHSVYMKSSSYLLPQVTIDSITAPPLQGSLSQTPVLPPPLPTPAPETIPQYPAPTETAVTPPAQTGSQQPGSAQPGEQPGTVQPQATPRPYPVIPKTHPRKSYP